MIVAGRYRLLGRIGQGAMGAVWRAEHLPTGREVAVKIPRTGAASVRAPERLLREGALAMRVRHTSAVRVLEVGDEAAPFVAMELLTGETLDEVLARRGRLPAEEAVALLLPVLGALAAAHDAGVVHRDVKPENVLLAKRHGRIVPKVLDFGIARDVRAGGRILTHGGTVLGSPAYMAPEQAAGRAVDERADVWSVAVLLYECITGERPFTGTSVDALLESAALDEARPFPAFGIDEPELWAIVRRGLAKRPSKRWATTRAFAAELAIWAARRGVRHDVTGASLASHVAPPRPSRAGVAIAAVLLAAAAVVVASVGASSPAGRPALVLVR